MRIFLEYLSMRKKNTSTCRTAQLLTVAAFRLWRGSQELVAGTCGCKGNKKMNYAIHILNFN